jgi:hypothetical protein
LVSSNVTRCPFGGTGPTSEVRVDPVGRVKREVWREVGNHEFERVLADAIGQDLGQPGTALAPRLAALTAVTGLRELYETDEARALPSPPKAADLLALVDRVIAFTRAGIDRSPGSPTSRRTVPASLTRQASKRDP